MLDQGKSPNKVPTTVLLSVLTAPFLLTVIAIESLSNSLIELGQTSEEVFRGERLPVLDSEVQHSTSKSN
jgi:hypothetical protein